MRYLLATGVFALLLAGTGTIALADPATDSQPATAVTTTATTPSTAAATTTEPSSSDAVEPGVPVTSPDVVQWTAQLMREQQSEAVHKTVLPHEHGNLGRFAGRILSRTTTIAKNLTRDALRFLGTPYVFGGTSSSGFDCSGFVQHVFAMLGVSIPRTADAQYYAEHRAKGGVRTGDLVFFQTYEPGPSHVGIYLGHGKFVHASSHGVMVSSLSDSYWSERYLGAKRVDLR